LEIKKLSLNCLCELTDTGIPPVTKGHCHCARITDDAHYRQDGILPYLAVRITKSRPKEVASQRDEEGMEMTDSSEPGLAYRLHLVLGNHIQYNYISD
jgi:hypothetical protein